MMIFKQLYDSTLKYRKNAWNYPDVDGQLVNIVPNPSAGLITFHFKVKSQKHRNEGYMVRIQFYNVEFSDHPLSSTSIKIIDKDTGKPLYFERISLTDKNKKNFVRVRCGCSDFRFRFAWEDRAVNALWGGVPKGYTPVPGSKRPPVNPEHLAGMCKHVYACAKAIQQYFSR